MGLTRATFRHVLTGSYHNYFRIFDVDSLSDIVLQADKSAFKAKKIGGPLPGNKLGAKNGTRGLRDAMQMETLDFNKKILHASWHPRESTIAVCSALSFRCGWIVDPYLYPLDRRDEQPVLVQCGMMSVLTLAKSFARLCRRRLSPTLLSSCRRLFLFSVQYIFQPLLFISPASSTLYFTTIAHHPPCSARSSLVFPRIIRRTHASSGPSPSPIFGSSSSTSLTRSPPFLIPHRRVLTPQCRVFPLTRQEVRKRRRITIRTYIFLELSEATITGACWSCRDDPTTASGHTWGGVAIVGNFVHKDQ